MFSASFRLGKIAGVEIGINASLILIAGLVTLFISDTYFPARAPGYATSIYLILGVFTSLLFFGSVLVHELAHALMAKYYKLPVHSIVLNLIGGVALIEEEAKTPRQMFWIAFIGPLSSAMLGVIGLGVGWLLRDSVGAVALVGLMFAWLGEVNMLLAAFNMIPAFPLDGGRVLLATIWGVSGRYLRAAQIAVGSGRLLAVGFIGMAGFSLLASGGLWGSIWWAFIGWFLWSSGSGYMHHARDQHILNGVSLRRVVRGQRVYVQADWPLVYALDVMAMQGPVRAAPVIMDNQIVGVFAIEQALRVPRIGWGTQRVAQVMTPSYRVETLSPDTLLMDALRHVDRTNADFLLIRDEVSTHGVIGIDDLVRFVEHQRRDFAHVGKHQTNEFEPVQPL